MSELEAAWTWFSSSECPLTVKRSNAVKLRVLKQLETFSESLRRGSMIPPANVGYLLRFFPATTELA